MSQEQEPIPFKVTDEKVYTGPSAGAPTTVQDCIKAGSHKRWYYQFHPHEPKLGELLGDKKVCEICGTVGI